METRCAESCLQTVKCEQHCITAISWALQYKISLRDTLQNDKHILKTKHLFDLLIIHIAVTAKAAKTSDHELLIATRQLRASTGHGHRHVIIVDIDPSLKHRWNDVPVVPDKTGTQYNEECCEVSQAAQQFHMQNIIRHSTAVFGNNKCDTIVSCYVINVITVIL